MRNSITQSEAVAVLPSKRGRYTLYGFSTLIMGVVLAADLASPFGVSVSSFYVLVIVLSFFSQERYLSVQFAFFCSLLLCIGMAFQADSQGYPVGILNRCLSLGLIWFVAFFGERLKKIQRESTRRQSQLIQMNRELERLSRYDALTGLANRRFFDETLIAECGRAYRQKTPISLIMIDIDFFKSFNDLNGHPAGDICLAQIAQTIQMNARRSGDLVARYGGEEFAVILPSANAEGGTARAEAIRQSVAALELEHLGSNLFQKVTISLGVATYNPGHQKITPEILIQFADNALYRAKELGRNRVIAQEISTLDLPLSKTTSASSVG